MSNPTKALARWACVLLSLIAIASATGCAQNDPAPAVGANDEISVFINTSRDGPVAGELRRLFAYPIEVVGSEDAFRLDFIPFDQFRIHRQVKNQIFAVDLSRDDDLARALPGMLGGAGKRRLAERKPFLFIAPDAWATGQTTLFAAAWSADDLHRLFAESDSTALRREYERSVTAGLVQTMFGLGEETVLPREVGRKYGWTIRLMGGFFGADDPDRKFVKFNAADPVRLLLVHWLDRRVPLDEESWTPVLSSILDLYNDGDFVLAERTVVYPETFQDQPALKWEGVWQNEKYVIGGPFRAYAFHRGERSFVLVGQVFNPGQDKVPALRQLEAMMTTFRLVD
jgi:hypothetical protein